jgi:fumarate reductase subunit D
MMTPAALVSNGLIIFVQTASLLALWFYETLELVLVHQREKLANALSGFEQSLLAVDLVLLCLLFYFGSRMWMRVLRTFRDFAVNSAAVLASICYGLAIAVPAVVLISLLSTLFHLAIRDHPSLGEFVAETRKIIELQLAKMETLKTE